MKNLYFTLVVIGLGGVTAACVATANALVVDPFETTPCAAPCWHNVTPGISTESQVLGLLANNSLAPNCTNYSQGEFQGIDCEEVKIWWDPTAKIVETVQLVPSKPITLEQVIDNFGDPEFVLIDGGEGSVEMPSTLIVLYYISRGTSFRLEQIEYREPLTLSPNSKIVEVLYRESQKTEEFQQQTNDMYGDSVQLVGWHGYDNYEQYIDK